MTDERHDDPFLAGAYGLTDLASAMAFYGQWAGEYDNRMEEVLGYVAPRLMAGYLSEHLPDKGAQILDAGCGTGLTSDYLSRLGFGIFDGIDLNLTMLEHAEKRGIYRRLIHADLTQTLPVDSDSFDAVISSGTFTLGHVGAEPIPELLRVLRPGGLLGCSIHKDIWEPKGFALALGALEASGKLAPVARIKGEFFTGLGETALYCVYKKSGEP